MTTYVFFFTIYFWKGLVTAKRELGPRGLEAQATPQLSDSGRTQYQGTTASGLDTDTWTDDRTVLLEKKYAGGWMF